MFVGQAFFLKGLFVTKFQKVSSIPYKRKGRGQNIILKIFPQLFFSSPFFSSGCFVFEIKRFSNGYFDLEKIGETEKDRKKISELK